jgi:hypothetical protein
VEYLVLEGAASMVVVEFLPRQIIMPEIPVKYMEVVVQEHFLIPSTKQVVLVLVV